MDHLTGPSIPGTSKAAKDQHATPENGLIVENGGPATPTTPAAQASKAPIPQSEPKPEAAPFVYPATQVSSDHASLTQIAAAAAAAGV